MMRTDYFRLRDLKNWLETIPEEDRVMPCFIGGDDTLHYLKIRLVDVDPSKPIIITKESEYSMDEVEHMIISDGDFEESEDNEVTVTEIKQYIECWYSREFTSVSDLLEKIEKLGPDALDLVLFDENGVDLKTYVDKGIGIRDTTDNEVAEEFCCGMCCGDIIRFPENTTKNPDAYDRAEKSMCGVIKAWKHAFVIEYTDGSSFQDFRFYNAWDENKD